MLHYFLKEDLRVLGLKFCKVGSWSDGVAFNGSIKLKGCLTCNFIHMADSHLTPPPSFRFLPASILTLLYVLVLVDVRILKPEFLWIKIIHQNDIQFEFLIVTLYSN